eukprot:RCo008387
MTASMCQLVVVLLLLSCLPAWLLLRVLSPARQGIMVLKGTDAVPAHTQSVTGNSSGNPSEPSVAVAAPVVSQPGPVHASSDAEIAHERLMQDESKRCSWSIGRKYRFPAD